MNLKKLHLEKIKLPRDLSKKLKDDEEWEYDAYEGFLITAISYLENEKEIIRYSLEFSPPDDTFEEVNNRLETHRYVADGTGWGDYILDNIKKDNIQFQEEVISDSETDTCILQVFNETDFRTLLDYFSYCIRNLFVAKPGTKQEDSLRTVTINRFWSNYDEESIARPSIMFKRPRIDYRVSEYIWQFLENNLLTPKKIWQKNDLQITLFIGPLEESHKFFQGSAFDTEIKKYSSHVRGNKLKRIDTFCSYNGFTSTMSPKEYADLIYDMYCSVLINNFKKVTRPECDKLKNKLDYSYIDSFEYPASFDNQKYSGDEGSYEGKIIDVFENIMDENSIPFNYRETYIKEFGK